MHTAMLVHQVLHPVLTQQTPAPPVSVPDFRGGGAPPGADKLVTVGHWVLWTASAVAVIGVIIVGAQMAYAHQHGELQQHGKRLGAAMLGIIVIGSATAITAALI